jgi:hypothetical protein
VSDFPPADIRSFLSFCAGEWLALRSRFDPEQTAGPGEAAAGAAAADDGEESWHSAERGELVVAYLEPEDPGAPGGLAITPPTAAGPTRRLIFTAGGRFRSGAADRQETGEQEGEWRLRPDGSLELTIVRPSSVVFERIWFTKPNLRLRSSVERRHDGSPGQASFSSEIRRLRRPAGPDA